MIKKERLLRAEEMIVRETQQAITANGFMALAEAARQTNIPLSARAHGLRTGRVPAVKVQPRRWLVRIDAVRLYMSVIKNEQATEERVERELARQGIIAKQNASHPRLKPFKPLKVGGRSVLDYLAEGRR